MQTTFTEENYIKAIYKLQEKNDKEAANTNDIALSLKMKAASVTDMIKRLSDKKIITYKKYYGVSLTKKGNEIALDIIRKHRLWEVFLVKKLHFKWDEVHDIAEQLEHINSKELINKLDDFLGNPKFDPHGDVIPSRDGKIKSSNSFPLNKAEKKQKLIFSGVLNHEAKFLQYLTNIHFELGCIIDIESVNDFDRSFKIKINNKHLEFMSEAIASEILVQHYGK